MAFRRIRRISAVPKVQQRLTPLKSLRQKDGKRLPLILAHSRVQRRISFF